MFFLFRKEETIHINAIIEWSGLYSLVWAAHM